MKNQINSQLVAHIANLANIPITKQEEEELAVAFSETLKVVEELKGADTKGVEPTHQVTGLTNVTRKDEVNPAVMFTQEEALANAKKTNQGYFVVERVIDAD